MNRAGVEKAGRLHLEQCCDDLGARMLRRARHGKARSERAATILGAAARLREEIGLRMPPHEEREYKRVVAAARAALGDDAFDQVWRGGGEMSLDDAVRYATLSDQDAVDNATERPLSATS